MAKILYKCGDFTIEEPNKDDRFEYYEELLKSETNNNVKPSFNLNLIGFRNKNKRTIRTIFRDDRDDFKALIIKYKNKYIGHSFLTNPDEKIPYADRMYIVKSMRNSKALACFGDYFLNYKYDNLLSKSETMNGFLGRIEPVMEGTTEPVKVKDVEKMRKFFARVCKGSKVYE